MYMCKHKKNKYVEINKKTHLCWSLLFWIEEKEEEEKNMCFVCSIDDDDLTGHS